MTGPSLSVIIPTYNRAAFVRNCLLSLRKSGVPDLEVIVSDDGSTDDTAEVVAATDPTAKYLWQPNTGTPTTAKNKGFAVSTGRYVGFLDCDDEWVDGAPGRIVELLDRHPEVGMMVGDTLIGCPSAGWHSLNEKYGPTRFDAVPHCEPEPGFRVFDRAGFYRKVIERNQWSVHSAILRREVFEAAGGFDPGMREAEDWDLWLRAACQTTVGMMDAPLGRYFLHDGAMSRNAEERFAHGFCKALRNAMRRAPLTADQRMLIRSRLRGELFHLAYQAYDKGQFCDARERFAGAMRAGNLHPRTAAYWLACHLPEPALRGIRGLKRSVTVG